MEIYLENIKSIAWRMICTLALGAIMGIIWPTSLPAAINKLKPKVYYISNQKSDFFESRILPFFNKQVGDCNGCQILDSTPYNEKGEFMPESLKQKLLQIPDDEGGILFFDWNEKMTSENEYLIELVSAKIKKGLLVIANAGFAKANSPTVPLNKTIFGRIPDIVIIGELEGRDVLPAQGFYGPQMLTAVRLPKEFKGQGFGPLYFVSRFTPNSKRRQADEWVNYFRQRKAKSREVWPDINEFM